MSNNIIINNIQYTKEQVLNNSELYETHLKKLKYEQHKIRMRERNRQKTLENPIEFKHKNNEYFKNRYHTDEEFRQKMLIKYKKNREDRKALKILTGLEIKPKGRPRKYNLDDEANLCIMTH